MPPTQSRSELEHRIERIDELIQQLDSGGDPALRAAAQELVQTVMDLHGAGLERIVSLLRRSGAPGQAMVEQFSRDELVQSLLLLYDLHPQDVEARVRSALDRTRPYLQTHGGNVELVSIEGGTRVHLRLEGSCHGCPSSSLTLKMAVEQAIRESAPEITAIVADGETGEEVLPLIPQGNGATSAPHLVELTVAARPRARSAAGSA